MQMNDLASQVLYFLNNVFIMYKDSKGGWGGTSTSSLRSHYKSKPVKNPNHFPLEYKMEVFQGQLGIAVWDPSVVDLAKGITEGREDHRYSPSPLKNVLL